MAYTIENGMWRSVFAVPSEIVDSPRFKFLGEVPLKVLLVLLRYNGGLDELSLSSIVGKPVPVIREALECLAAEGIIGGGEKPAPSLTYTSEPESGFVPEKTGPDGQAEARERKITTVSSERLKLSRDEISRLAEDDETVAWLLQESQQVLGKTLGASETETIVALYSYYGIKPDIIMMILQYCKSVDKTNMRYVEKVAASWIDGGIETHEQAEREIQRLHRIQSIEGRVKSVFDIYDRSLVPNEHKYIPVWIDEYGFDIPMLRLAYEQNIELTGKRSFAYMNKILTSWHIKGIRTPKDALSDIDEEKRKRRESFKKPRVKPGEKSDSATSYDLSELESMLNQGAL